MTPLGGRDMSRPGKRGHARALQKAPTGPRRFIFGRSMKRGCAPLSRERTPSLTDPQNTPMLNPVEGIAENVKVLLWKLGERMPSAHWRYEHA